MVGKNDYFANPVFLKEDLYKISKLVNSVNTAGSNRCETVLKGESCSTPARASIPMKCDEEQNL